MANILSKEGVIYTKFYNNGPTYTSSGHTSITTGVYQEIDNSGSAFPDNPSYFQEYRKAFQYDSSLTWIIASKDKLGILADSKDPEWTGKYKPSRDCGISGPGTGYRHDSLTLKKVLSVLTNYHPQLVLVNFREPDYSGHTGNFSEYIKGIELTDEYVYKIWEFIQKDNFYKNSTALFVTNDHGRHLDGINGGFTSHGDTCSGCRHISLYAFGPDFKRGIIVNNPGELKDISATIASMLHFHMSHGSGFVLNDIFK
jgi:predicted AlkP superfamily pyrophosphatase or phosphodiesterase